MNLVRVSSPFEIRASAGSPTLQADAPRSFGGQCTEVMSYLAKRNDRSFQLNSENMLLIKQNYTGRIINYVGRCDKINLLCEDIDGNKI